METAVPPAPSPTSSSPPAVCGVVAVLTGASALLCVCVCVVLNCSHAAHTVKVLQVPRSPLDKWVFIQTCSPPSLPHTQTHSLSHTHSFASIPCLFNSSPHPLPAFPFLCVIPPHSLNPFLLLSLCVTHTRACKRAHTHFPLGWCSRVSVC